MKKLITVLALITLSAFASREEAFNLKELTLFPKCSGFDVTEAQEGDIKAIFQEARADLKDQFAALKKGKKIFKAVMFNPATSKEEARMAREAFKMLKRPVKMRMREAKAAVNFDILSGEQRVTLLMCKIESRKKCYPKRGHRTL